MTLVTAGAYQVVLDGLGGSTGAATIALATVTDISGAIVPNGAPVIATVSVAGQRAKLSFSATTGQRVAITTSASTFQAAGGVLTLLGPTGSPLGPSIDLASPASRMPTQSIGPAG